MNDLGELLMIVLFMGGSAVLFGGIIWLAIWMRKKNIQKWQTFAEANGLQCSDPGFFGRPEITGRFRNHQVHVYIYTTGGKNKSTYTVTKVMLNQPQSLGLKVYKEGFFSKIGKAIGTQDIQTGDQAFDDAMMIKGNDEVGVTEYLTPALRDALSRLIGQHPTINFDDSGTDLTMNGWVTDASRLQPLMEAMEEVCQIADGGQPAQAGQPAPAAVQPGFTAEPPPEPAGAGGFELKSLPVDLDED